jgi:hypothetical protein
MPAESRGGQRGAGGGKEMADGGDRREPIPRRLGREPKPGPAFFYLHRQQAGPIFTNTYYPSSRKATARSQSPKGCWMLCRTSAPPPH